MSYKLWVCVKLRVAMLSKHIWYSFDREKIRHCFLNLKRICFWSGWRGIIRAKTFFDRKYPVNITIYNKVFRGLRPRVVGCNTLFGEGYIYSVFAQV